MILYNSRLKTNSLSHAQSLAQEIRGHKTYNVLSILKNLKLVNEFKKFRKFLQMLETCDAHTSTERWVSMIHKPHGIEMGFLHGGSRMSQELPLDHINSPTTAICSLFWSTSTLFSCNEITPDRLLGPSITITLRNGRDPAAIALCRVLTSNLKLGCNIKDQNQDFSLKKNFFLWSDMYFFCGWRHRAMSLRDVNIFEIFKDQTTFNGLAKWGSQFVLTKLIAVGSHGSATVGPALHTCGNEQWSKPPQQRLGRAR